MQNRRSVFAAKVIWRVGPHGDIVAILPSANLHQPKYGVCGRYNVMLLSSTAVVAVFNPVFDITGMAAP